MLKFKSIRSTSRYLVQVPSMGANARSPGGLVASNQGLTWNNRDISCSHWHIVAGCDEVFRPEMAVSERNTWQFRDDIIRVGDAEVSSWLSSNVVCSGLLSNLRSTIGIL